MSYEEELKLYLEATVKNQKAVCGCRRTLDRQPGVECWLIREWHPCPDHADDRRIATMWM